jgi:hypothetical protein
MNRTPSGNLPPEIEAFLAAERTLVPEPDDLRLRAISRARAVVLQGPPQARGGEVQAASSFPLGKAAAALILLVGLTAAGYELGYRRSQGEGGREVAKALPLPPPIVPVVTPTPPTATNVDPVVIPSRPAARPRPGSGAAARQSPDAYAQELRWLRPARAALAQASFARALALVEEHQRRFPAGRLAEEREALRVKALLGLDRRAEAQRAAGTFRRQFPKSALLNRIEGMSGNEP